MADRLEGDSSTLSLNEPLSKLDDLLLAMVDKKKEGNAFSPEESARLQDGKVMVQVWLADTKEETLAQLKELGFKTVAQPRSGHLVIGYLPVEKLEALAKLSTVRYVTLQLAAA